MIPGPAQWVKGSRVAAEAKWIAAVAQIQSPYTVSAAIKEKKEKKI